MNKEELYYYKYNNKITNKEISERKETTISRSFFYRLNHTH